jgi:hypothetical protein
MEFLQRIDFENHDGVNLPMINDFMRNQFYDRVLEHRVQGQHCMDIGFGTGLLSVLAIKHGAIDIVAYESDVDRYELGCQIIELLGLQDRITLLNQRYDHTMGLRNIDIVFTETVNGNLWWEGLYNSIPRTSGYQFLPGQYFLEIHAVSIPEAFAHGLIAYSEDSYRFAPGINIDEKFVSAVNLMIAKKYCLPVQPKNKNVLQPGIVNFERQQSTVWGQTPYRRAIAQGQCVANYVLDIQRNTVNDRPIDFDQHILELHVDTDQYQDHTVLIVPRAGMQHGNNKMYLDTGHWGPAENPIILHKPKGNLMITHDLHDGKIAYKLEELK